jgi:exosortase H (IPTLxxWG-CTERM-specific)
VRPGRFLVLFGACFLVGYAALMTPWVKPAVMDFDRVLVYASGTLIHLCRGHVDAGGTVLRDPSTGLAIEMKDGCNGVNVTVLLCAALLAFPASWSLKVKGLLIGCGAIQLVNLLRFISLFYLLHYNRGWFDFAHDYLWESLIMLDALAVFWMWVQVVFRSTAMRNVHA